MFKRHRPTKTVVSRPHYGNLVITQKQITFCYKKFSSRKKKVNDGKKEKRYGYKKSFAYRIRPVDFELIAFESLYVRGELCKAVFKVLTVF